MGHGGRLTSTTCFSRAAPAVAVFCPFRSAGERIEQSYAQPLNILDIARHQSEVVNFGGGGYETVNDGHVADGIHLAPNIGNGGVNREDTPSEKIL